MGGHGGLQPLFRLEPAFGLTGVVPRPPPPAGPDPLEADGSAPPAQGGPWEVLILGGGSPKNFVLQTEPQIQEVLGLEDKGHDYFVQVTDARPDTGGLSGATPGEAVSWGKVDPDKLPDSVVVYGDSTVVAPLLAAYALSRSQPRPLRRLYDHREAMLDRLRAAYVARD